MLLPKLRMSLDPRWMVFRAGNHAPLGWRFDDVDGTLHASSPDALADFHAEAADDTPALELLSSACGPVVEVTRGTCSFGRLLAARHRNGDFEEVLSWLLMNDRVPNVLFTWFGAPAPAAVPALVAAVVPASPAPIEVVRPVFDMAAGQLAEGAEILPAIFADIDDRVIMSLLEDDAYGSWILRAHTVEARPDAVTVLYQADWNGEACLYVQYETPSMKDAFWAPILAGPPGTLGAIERTSYRPWGAAYDFFEGA